MRTCVVYIPASTRTIISAVCSKCGTIEKSRKASCCGRGGSWFRKCGASSNSKFDHTWSEGIQACKSRTPSNWVIAQKLNVAKETSSGSSSDVDIDTSIMTVKTAVNPPTPILGMITPVNAAIKSPIHTLITMPISTTAAVYSSASVFTTHDVKYVLAVILTNLLRVMFDSF